MRMDAREILRDSTYQDSAYQFLPENSYNRCPDKTREKSGVGYQIEKDGVPRVRFVVVLIIVFRFAGGLRYVLSYCRGGI